MHCETGLSPVKKMEKGKYSQKAGAREMKYREHLEGCRSAATRAPLSSGCYAAHPIFPHTAAQYAPNCL